MENFEKELKSLRLKTPDPELKRRIFGSRKQTVSQKRQLLSRIYSRRIPILLAAAIAILMGAAGFMLAELLHQYDLKGKQKSEESVKVEIIYNNKDSKNIFDFTESPKEFLKDNPKVEIKTGKEV